MKSRYTINVKLRIRKNGRVECSAKSCGYFPLKKVQREDVDIFKGERYVCVSSNRVREKCLLRNSFDLINGTASRSNITISPSHKTFLYFGTVSTPHARQQLYKVIITIIARRVFSSCHMIMVEFVWLPYIPTKVLVVLQFPRSSFSKYRRGYTRQTRSDAVYTIFPFSAHYLCSHLPQPLHLPQKPCVHHHSHHFHYLHLHQSFDLPQRPVCHHLFSIYFSSSRVMFIITILTQLQCRKVHLFVDKKVE